MNPEIKKRWVEALRSGDYKQTAGALRYGDNSFCCLGVLCDLYLKERGEEGAWDILRHNGLPPPEILEWSGLQDRYGDEVAVHGHVHSLTFHNDNGDAIFAELADAIEQQL